MRFRPSHIVKGWSRVFALVGLFAFLGIVGIHSAPTATAAPTPQTIQFDVDLDEWALIPEDVTFQVGDTGDRQWWVDTCAVIVAKLCSEGMLSSTEALNI